MGLFDKKDKKRGKDDFDSPMESIDLNQVSAPAPATSAPRAEAAAPPPAAPAAPAAASAGLKPEPAIAAPAPRPAPPAPPPPSPASMMSSPDADSYGIDKAIELMRTLPSENIQLVVQVVKFSLESVGIKLPVIIDDAIRRQKDLRGRVDVLKSEIADLEQEISQRKSEIEKHEADYRETTTVRERLELAEGLNKGKPEAVAAAAAASSSSGTDTGRAQRVTGPLAALSPTGPTAAMSPPKK